MSAISELWQLITSPPNTDSLSAPEWTRLVALTEAHGVAPLLYSKLKNFSTSESYSFPMLKNIEKSYYQSAGHGQVLKGELDMLGASFDRDGIPWLPLKGAALAWTVYPDPALRPMHDLDLLVQPVDLLRAVRTAQVSGYHLDKLTYHALLRGGPNNSISLELHWCLPGAQPAPSHLFDESNHIRTKLLDSFTYLYCCAHLVRQHANNPRLIWLYDLHLLHRLFLDRIELLELSEQLGLSAELAVVENISIDNIPSLLKISMQSKISTEIKSSLSLLPLAARLRMSSTLLFPSKDYMKWHYKPKPEWLWPAYYPRRLAERVKREAFR